jgi:hypothetical protein
VTIVGIVVRPAAFVRYFGGLGNQLFQYNFAKYLELELGRPVGMIRSKSPLRADRKFELDTFLAYQQEAIALAKFAFPGFRNKIIQGLNSRLELIGMSVENTEKDPFGSTQIQSLIGSKLTVFSGYFQNIGLVSKAAPVYLNQLKAFLAPIASDVRRRLDLPVSAPVAHVRRGDLLKPENVGMGLLAPEYYKKALLALGKADLKPVILTDDLQNVKMLAENLGAVRVLDPSEVGTWEALAIFSTSEFLVTSNSTLSWWGGYLGTTQGNQVAMPSTWFKDESVQPESSLHIPNTSLIESSFD